LSRTAAVIDVGSNTVRLLVARVGESELEEAHTERVQLGLGRELEAEGSLSAATVSATAEAVKQLCSGARARHAESVDVFVTAPGRQAENASDLVGALERAAGVRVRILSAEEEARLGFAGAVAVAAQTAPLVAVVDLGGASTEIAVGRPEAEPAWLRSVDLGALRLTERLLEEPHPSTEEVDAARAAVAEAFEGVVPPLPGAALAVGGCARALGRVLGSNLGAGELSAAVSLLPMWPPEAIAERFGVGKRRGPLLLAASIILAEVQSRLMVPLVVTDGGVREGALLAAQQAAAA
jgi:exopolyphosphatase/guanosine-5'-triphosphate,3'-diphosphate pyrophosphatase